MNKKLIFVYGSLKRGKSNYPVMGDSKFLGEAKIKGFKMHSLGGFPALTRGDMEITGEVFEVDNPHVLNRIYQLEGYSGVRGSHNNWYDTDDVDTPYGKAELFFMKDESKYQDRQIVESGIW
jgi:gamma-glutamylcyclotransferase (GGCT)/AIG2-like uncharacterized protein YtfP